MKKTVALMGKEHPEFWSQKANVYFIMYMKDGNVYKVLPRTAEKILEVESENVKMIGWILLRENGTVDNLYKYTESRYMQEKMYYIHRKGYKARIASQVH